MTLPEADATLADTKQAMEDLEMAQQLTAQYVKAVGAMAEVVKFGAMMIMLEATLSTRGQGNGNGRKGDGVKGWLEKHCPGVKRATAYRFMDVVLSMTHDYAKIVGAKAAKQIDLPKLVTTPADKLPGALAKKQLELFDFVSGTSQRSWLDRFKAPTPVGGSNYVLGAGKGERKPPTPEEAAQLLQGLCQQAGAALSQVHKKKAFTALSTAELDGLADHCRAVLDDVTAWKALTPAQRREALAQQTNPQI